MLTAVDALRMQASGYGAAYELRPYQAAVGSWPNKLLSGPAGAGKSQEAAAQRQAADVLTVVADFQSHSMPQSPATNAALTGAIPCVMTACYRSQNTCAGKQSTRHGLRILQSLPPTATAMPGAAPPCWTV